MLASAFHSEFPVCLPLLEEGGLIRLIGFQETWSWEPGCVPAVCPLGCAQGHTLLTVLQSCLFPNIGPLVSHRGSPVTLDFSLALGKVYAM